MHTLSTLLHYWFWPNPGFAAYNSPDIIAGIILCSGMILGSFAISYWRRKQESHLTRKLSASWSSVSFWFGLIGLVLIVSRVEDIQFFAMRFLWVIWTVILLLYVFFQWRKWRLQHYEIMPTVVTHDPRDHYLPRKKKK